MMAASPDPRSTAVRRRGSQRGLAAVALATVGVCGLLLLMVPPPSVNSLLSRSNWELATALPAIDAFPADWNYDLWSDIVQPTPAATTGSGPLTTRGSVSQSVPAGCGDVPTLVGLYDGVSRSAAMVHVDLRTDEIAKAILASSDEPEPNARFVIWRKPNGAQLIADYLGWIGRCGSYRVTSPPPDNHTTTVTTTVSVESVTGTDAAVIATRSSISSEDSQTYHVMFYALRSVVLECATNLTGDQVDMVRRLADQTLHRLHTL